MDFTKLIDSKSLYWNDYWFQLFESAAEEDFESFMARMNRIFNDLRAIEQVILKATYYHNLNAGQIDKELAKLDGKEDGWYGKRMKKEILQQAEYSFKINYCEEMGILATHISITKIRKLLTFMGNFWKLQLFCKAMPEFADNFSSWKQDYVVE